MSKTRFLAGTCVIAIAGALVLGVAAPVKAEVGEVRLAQQFGVGYLPLQMMREWILNLYTPRSPRGGDDDRRASPSSTPSADSN